MDAYNRASVVLNDADQTFGIKAIVWSPSLLLGYIWHVSTFLCFLFWLTLVFLDFPLTVWPTIVNSICVLAWQICVWHHYILICQILEYKEGLLALSLHSCIECIEPSSLYTSTPSTNTENISTSNMLLSLPFPIGEESHPNCSPTQENQTLHCKLERLQFLMHQRRARRRTRRNSQTSHPYQHHRHRP